MRTWPRLFRIVTVIVVALTLSSLPQPQPVAAAQLTSIQTPIPTRSATPIAMQSVPNIPPAESSAGQCNVYPITLSTLALVGLLVVGYVSITALYNQQIATLPNAVAAASQSARILDKNGKQLNDPNTGARPHVNLAHISPYLIAATIATEDQHFYTEPGFDPIGIVCAVLANLTAGSGVQGTSPITQQLARALILDQGAAQDRSLWRKLTEIVVASEVARRYTRSQVLEYYLNTESWRKNGGVLRYGKNSQAVMGKGVVKVTGADA